MRKLRLTLVAMLLGGSLNLLGLFGGVTIVVGCDCMQPGPIGQYANDPGALVVEGTVTAVAQTRGTFKIERWYKGSSDVAEVPVSIGDGANCGIPLTVGQHLVMVAYESEGTLDPNICAPYGDLTTAEGKQLQADAVAAYGEGTVPKDAAQPPPSTGFQVPGFVILGGAAIAAIVVIVLGASVLSGRRGA
jgi:hypothetical protein